MNMLARAVFPQCSFYHTLHRSLLMNPQMASRTVTLALALFAAIVLFSPSASAQTGACCVGTSCSLRTLASCDGVLGDWLGPGTNCSGSPCGGPTGTCCIGTTCSIRTAGQCATASGSFLGGSSCAPNPCSGSCCINAICSITASTNCISSGGAWLRFGSCSPNICPGPCCDAGVCTITVQSLCTAGSVWSPGGTCNPNSCLPPQCETGITGNLGGMTTALARVGTTGLLVARGSTLELLNLSNPNAPAPFNPPRRILLPGVAVKIAMSPAASRAFVLLEGGDIVFVTIATTPQLLVTERNIIDGFNVSDIEVDGDRVYIPQFTDQPHGVSSRVYIYDRAANNQPQLMGQFEPLLQNFEVDRVAKIGNVLWLAMHQYQSDVYAIEGWNVANPAAPLHLSSFVGFSQNPDTASITTLQPIGNKLVLTYKSGGVDTLRIADVTNPALPVWHTPVGLNGPASCSSANGNHLRLGVNNRIETWDTTNPSALTLLGVLVDAPVFPKQISAGASVDYIAVGRYGLRTARFITPALPQTLATLTSSPASPSLVRQIGNTTVVYDTEFQVLRTFDYTRPESQQLLASLSVPFGYYYNLALTQINSGSQTLAILSDGVNSATHVIEITNPAAPVLRSTIGAAVRELAATNARLYCVVNTAIDQPRLNIYDLSNPTVPTLLNFVSLPGVWLDYACIASWESGSTKAVAIGGRFGLTIVDATSLSPQVASVYSPVPGMFVNGVLKTATSLFLASNTPTFSSRLESLNVNNLSSPTLQYASDVGVGAGSLFNYASLAYISSPSGPLLAAQFASGFGMSLFDLSSPLGQHVPHQIFSFSTQQTTSGIAPNSAGSKLLLAGVDAGLQQISLPLTWPPGFSSPAPATRTVCLASAASIQAHASANPASITYQWFRVGTPSVALTNGPTPWGTIIAGASTPTLSISNLRPQDADSSYFCRAFNTCGSRDSPRVELAICLADINCTGTLTVQDIFDFLAAYFAGDPLADINGVGGLSVQDIFDFLVAWFSGCP